MPVIKIMTLAIDKRNVHLFNKTFTDWQREQCRHSNTSFKTRKTELDVIQNFIFFFNYHSIENREV